MTVNDAQSTGSTNQKSKQKTKKNQKTKTKKQNDQY